MYVRLTVNKYIYIYIYIYICIIIFLFTDNLTYIYNHILLLYKLGRQQEAAKMWLSQRGINTPLDPLQSANILKKKKDCLR